MPARDPFFQKHVEFQMTGRENLTDLGKPSTSDFSRKTMLKPENGWPSDWFFHENQGAKNHVKGSTNT